MNSKQNFRLQESIYWDPDAQFWEEHAKNLNKQKLQKGKSVLINHDLNPKNRLDYVHNDSNQTIIMIGNQTCSRRSSEY